MSLVSHHLSKESTACSKRRSEGGERTKLSQGGWTQWGSARVVQRAEQVRAQEVGLNKSGLGTGGVFPANRGRN